MKTQKDLSIEELRKQKDDESKQMFQFVTARRRNDGSLYHDRKESIERYRSSYLPYPLAALFKLDYCYKIFCSHLKNSFFFAGPLALLSIYVRKQEARNKGFRAVPFSYIVSHYIFMNLVLIGIFTIDCLVFCDYCKPWSPIYSLDSDSEYFKKALMPKLKREKESYDVLLNRTKTAGLKDEEL